MLQTKHERTLGDNSLLEQRIEQLVAKNKDQLDLSVELAERNSQIERELGRREEEVQRLKQEVAHGNKVRDGLQRKLHSAEEQKAELESKRESLKQQIGSLERGECSTPNERSSVSAHKMAQSWRVSGDRQSWIRERMRIS